MVNAEVSMAARFGITPVNIVELFGSEILNLKMIRSAKKENITAFIKELEQKENLILEFDEELCKGTVENIVELMMIK